MKTDWVKEAHKEWLVEKSDRKNAENWCYVVSKSFFNRSLDLPFNSNSSQCIAKQFFTLRRSSFAYQFTIDAARRASDYSKRIHIRISLLRIVEEIWRELIPIICWVITFCTHRQPTVKLHKSKQTLLLSVYCWVEGEKIWNNNGKIIWREI